MKTLNINLQYDYILPTIFVNFVVLLSYRMLSRRNLSPSESLSPLASVNDNIGKKTTIFTYEGYNSTILVHRNVRSVRWLEKRIAKATINRFDPADGCHG